MDVGDQIVQTITGGVQYARVSERILAGMIQVKNTKDQLMTLLDLDGELVPEVETAIEHLAEAQAALFRAGEFCDARFQVQLEILRGDPDDADSD